MARLGQWLAVAVRQGNGNGNGRNPQADQLTRRERYLLVDVIGRQDKRLAASAGCAGTRSQPQSGRPM